MQVSGTHHQPPKTSPHLSVPSESSWKTRWHLGTGNGSLHLHPTSLNLTLHGSCPKERDISRHRLRPVHDANQPGKTGRPPCINSMQYTGLVKGVRWGRQCLLSYKHSQWIVHITSFNSCHCDILRTCCTDQAYESGSQEEFHEKTNWVNML